MYIWIDSCINFFNDDILIKFIAVIQLDVSLFTRSLSGAAVVSLKLLYHNFAYCPQSFERRPHKMLRHSNNSSAIWQRIVWMCLTILWGRPLTLFRMGFFGAAHGWGEAKKPPLLKICHTYPTMMKLGTVIPYTKKIQIINESCDTPLNFCWHQHFSTGNQQILLYQEIQI